MLESIIQSKIVNEAKKNGYTVLKIIKCNINGMSDIILFKDNSTIFVEVKNEKGIQSEIQKYVQKQLEKQGFKYYLVRSLEDFKQKIKQL
ncbi:VRR-NUC domain containing protein [uncultured Caudovirales phage]|uniref:VRR-NUC domain containing protein n=1 Tax=uncultured Caudovirales phage TaxID=2100421 RepID=A0A6J5L3S7_9CAUD|nr:VRR-NUC domain containing protein [uncultured Caudovirales phage]CAB4134102.1 VRR-NUC domain containing protein [uncultured Caudovirales phage]